MSTESTVETSSLSLLGEIIHWSSRGTRTTYANLCAALDASGFDSSIARALLPRHAWQRACRQLKKERSIDQLTESEDGKLRFQLTRKEEAGDRIDFKVETFVTLDKHTGELACDDATILTQARELLSFAIDDRTGNDLTRLIQRLFERRAKVTKGTDLVPIRDQGGVYFVAANERPFVDQIATLVGALGVKLGRLSVANNTETRTTVKDAVVGTLDALFDEYKSAVAELGDGTKEFVLDRVVAKIELGQLKLEAYRQLLGDTLEESNKRYEAVRAELRGRVRAIKKEEAKDGRA